MTNDTRKAAIQAYRERKVEPGIYAIRCSATGAYWVGRAPDLSTIRNRLWFTLNHGSHRHASLQAAWNEHGAETFTFEAVEALPDEEMTSYLRDGLLKERLAHWMEELGALPV
ncbi:MAG TPA: GIY-YIG nuclease family protein [Sphingobium sp.]|uniref:GIY-YIG nuclease family protein n=1 Tax=Sphingobium sp. TaxID=1912891 RepID=UPI002ED59BD9